MNYEKLTQLYLMKIGPVFFLEHTAEYIPECATALTTLAN